MASCGERALAHVPPFSPWPCDMRASFMATLILRFARSMQDAVHKKLQPLGSLMLGDSHDRLWGVGGKKQERLLLLMPEFSGSHSYLPKDSGIIPVQHFGSLEHCRRTFKRLTIQIILISYRQCRSLRNKAKQIFMEFQHCRRRRLSSIRDAVICQGR